MVVVGSCVLLLVVVGCCCRFLFAVAAAVVLVAVVVCCRCCCCCLAVFFVVVAIAGSRFGVVVFVFVTVVMVVDGLSFFVVDVCAGVCVFCGRLCVDMSARWVRMPFSSGWVQHFGPNQTHFF